jgi:cytochrome c-type biogenesis protein CcmH
MDMFWYIAGGMVVLAVGFLLPPLLRRNPSTTMAQANAEITVFRQRQRELREDLQRGALDPATYQAAEQELQSAVLDAGQHFQTAAPIPHRHRLLALALLILIPGFAIGLYRSLGSHDEVVAIALQEAEAQRQSVELRTGIERLEVQLAKHPDDKKMWHMLGRAQLELKDYAKAYIALGKAEALDAGDKEIVLDKVVALAGMRDPSNATEQMSLIDRVLKIDPDSQRGLWIGSLVMLEQGRNDLARDYLQRLLRLLPADDKNTELIRRQLAALEQAPAEGDVAGEPEPGNASATGNASTAGVLDSAHITVNVRIDPAIATRVAADDTVFVFARARTGPRMPLAVERIRVQDLPKAIVLDDGKAMDPALRLGMFPDIMVGARISRSGQPEGGAGDYEGFAAQPIHLTAATNTAAVDVVIGTAHQ